MIELQVASELSFFLPRRHREAGARATQVAYDGSSSLGHVVESLGVPRTEVGALAVNGHPVTPAYRPDPGDLVNVTAPVRPQPLATSPPRFLLDVHLGTLARRMRLLGLDAAYRNDAADDELVERATAEQRLLLTQDRALLRRRALPHGAYVRGSRPADQLHDVLDRFAPPVAPYTKCTACNAPLAVVAKADVSHLLQPGTRRCYREFRRCIGCGRVYWRGAHAPGLDLILAGSSGPGCGRIER